MARIQQYSSLFRRSWWILALTVLAALNVALILAYFATPIYRASALFIVGPGPSLLSSEDRDLVNSIEALDKRSITATYAEVMNSGRIQRETADLMGIDPEELEDYDITAVVLPDASVLELSVEGPDAAKAASLANTVGKHAIDYIKSLYLVFDIHVLDPADASTNPTRPQPIRDISLAVVLGLVFGSALVLLREQLAPWGGGQGLRLPTGLEPIPAALSRSQFQKRLDNQLAKNKAEPLVLGLVQLKGVQDRLEALPSPVLEQLSQQVAKVLHHELGSNDILGRWDETSFAALLPATAGTMALQRFEVIQQALSKPLSLDGNGEMLYLEPHTGVAARQDGESAETLIRKAEAALKETYRNGSKTILFTQKQPVNGVTPTFSTNK
jgi:capsular polysaccharide biosynthesis protein/GGDEF domain-containing protein